MRNAMKINDEVTIGPQPGDDDIQWLSDQGFKAIVTFQTESEQEQPLSPNAEGEKAKAAGTEYLHTPSLDGLNGAGTGRSVSAEVSQSSEAGLRPL